MFVSIGTACVVSHQLKRINLQQESLFYDWVVSPHAKLVETLGLDVEETLFRKGVAFPQVGKYLTDLGTGLNFYPHDFKGIIERDIHLVNEQIEAVRTKYLRRAERMRAIFSSGEKIFVVRHFFSEPLENLPGQQKEISETLSKHYPQTEFKYVWGSELPSAGFQPHIGRLYHFPAHTVWTGDDAAWESAFLDSRAAAA
ncbi:DUF1796 family putative cysteine peptidase [Phyllobacterium sp. YR531]|uniref:DUF1796 family putative cysteine peptidase n=1 Tax=Phyllobacterium sp. YR531 TaxID=1144343 RepID=UPI00026FAA19|nr:DUF1796 family putative cysteine peptidase [Phyllobacterium sp. YR531]EJN02277.1 Putative papain-like cysteine peptidase (DUF1796) [Phyllobacterium sp. YR531]